MNKTFLKIFTFTISIVLLTGCQLTQVVTENSLQIEELNEKTIIIQNNNTQIFSLPEYRSKQLESKDYDEAYKMLLKEWKNHNQLKNFEDYYFQLTGIQDSEGNEFIWINAFCDKNLLRYWKNTFIQVLDGGNCFFNVKIDLKEKKWFDLYINGVA